MNFVILLHLFCFVFVVILAQGFIYFIYLLVLPFLSALRLLHRFDLK